MKVLDRGDVTLLNTMGNDSVVIAAARVSNGVEYSEASKGPDKDQKLINYLIKHRHGTPFEHATLQFYVKAPLFVVREWQRHRMASYNEISGRYVEFEPEFYIPEYWRIQSENNKQGSIRPTEDKLDFIKKEPGLLVFYDDYTVEEWDETLTQWMKEHVEAAFGLYETMLSFKVAKEMARMVLPLNLYTEFYFTVNARSLMNFLSLRAAEDAQFEIRMYATAIEQMFAEVMPMTYLAWVMNKRIAP